MADMKCGSPPAFFPVSSWRGQVVEESPYRGLDTWMQRRYRRLTPEMALDLRQVLADVIGRDEPLCEVCRGIARRAREGAR